jgi:hypothetical protein
VGIAVFEMKDWNLQAMQYNVEERIGKLPVLLGKKILFYFILVIYFDSSKTEIGDIWPVMSELTKGLARGSERTVVGLN